MLDFLSTDWLDALDEAARANRVALQADDAGSRLVIQQVITDRPGGDVAYCIRFDNGDIGVRSGRATDPTLSFTTDYGTARAIARGDESAQAAFIQGRLRVGGDVRALVRHAELLARLDAVFAPVRDETTY